MKIHHLTTKTIAILAVCSVLGSLPSQAATSVNDSFADGNRTTQNPPASLEWYSARASTTLTAATGAMTMTMGNTNHAIAYFTDSGSPLSLSVGEKLTLTINFSGTLSASTSSTSIRYGLLNSGGSRIGSDNQNVSDSRYTSYTGYAGVFGNDSTQMYANVWERTGTNNALLSSGTPWNIPTASVTTNSLVSDTPYTLTLTLDYQALSNMTVTGSLTGGTLSGVNFTYVDTTPVVSFDTLGLYNGTSPLSEVTFTSVNVSVIPEPTTTGLLVGALCLGVASIARRRSRS